MKTIAVKFLSKEDIESVLNLDRIIETTEDVFTHFGKGEIYSPPKESVPLQEPDLAGMQLD